MSSDKIIELNLELDELNSQRAESFFASYDFETIVGDSPNKTFLGEKGNSCRFCNKSEPEVKFTTLAHVIPQFMGNKNLVSHFECDNCNALFSKYEGSFANFIGISRTFAQIKGQTKKVPKYKDPKTGLEVFIGDTSVQMSIIEGKEVIKIDEENKTMDILTQRPGYIPIHIPKTIIKMGLSMLPFEELYNYDFARKFIVQSDKDEVFKDFKLLNIYVYFIPGPPKFSTPFVQLYKRKQSTEILCPERQVILYYANYCFQMVLPFADSDKNMQGKDIKLPLFPLLIDNSHFVEYGQYKFSILNLTSHEKKTGEEHTVRFSFTDYKSLI